ncbi:MAG: hypothetical protein LBQ52_10845 [Helicobacteraceae bacterium]|nr:hypothetical protein [Helicobacteraceae bacterium]
MDFWDDDESEQNQAPKEDKRGAWLYDIPEKLEPIEATRYYNSYQDRRDEIYSVYFSRLNRMEEWLEIYCVAQEKTPAKELAFAKLSALDLDLYGWAALYEARFDDKRIVDLCESRIASIAAGNFSKWKESYDLAPYGSNLQKETMRQMRALAKSYEELQDIYDRGEIGSPEQIAAVQDMALLDRPDGVERTDAIADEKEMIKRAVQRTVKEWRAEYEKYDLYDPRNEMAAINIFLSANSRNGDKKTAA